jgi:hypothetical protein
VANRERLPERRAAEVFDFEHNGRKWTACIGRFDDGRPAEIFLNTNKDSAVATLAQESAVIVSIALQYGAPAAVLQHALDGRDTGPIGKALQLIGGAP